MSNWSATPDAFPLGLAKLSQDTGWKYVAHNRYWSTANVCKVAALPRFPTSRLANPDCVTIADAKQNGGDFEFIIEKGGKAIPTTQRFWDYLMRVSKEWGMAVYEQDWLHNECKIVILSRFVAVRLANPKSITISGEGLNATLSSATLSTDWLHQMGAAATKAGVTVQYCMVRAQSSLDSDRKACSSNPLWNLVSLRVSSLALVRCLSGSRFVAQAYGRHTIASAEIPAVNQIRASDDYATGDKLDDHDPNNANLYVGMSSMLAAALGLAPSKDVSEHAHTSYATCCRLQTAACRLSQELFALSLLDSQLLPRLTTARAALT